MKQILGIHHITAIASSAADNYAFYTDTLGLRLVKKTVNFDDPQTYHLYYGDETGAPGTILTFFPWANARRGRPGAGQATTVAFSIPDGSLGYWQERTKDLYTEPIENRFGDNGISLRDPDGMAIELIESGPAGRAWAGVPAEAAITGFYSTTLEVTEHLPTNRVLGAIMGLELIGDDGRRFRFKAPQAPGAFIDVVHLPSGPWGEMGAGAVHHVAFRVSDDETQVAWREKLTEEGLHVSPVMDRNYFHSIYFREPGGVLFEIATDPPGFAVDEPVETMGSELKLPEWLEGQRDAIQSVLPRLEPEAV